MHEAIEDIINRLAHLTGSTIAVEAMPWPKVGEIRTTQFRVYARVGARRLEESHSDLRFALGKLEEAITLEMQG